MFPEQNLGSWKIKQINVGKQYHKPPIWEWIIPPIYGDLGHGLLLFTQITGKTISFPWSSGACGALVLLIFSSSVCPHKL